MIKLLLLAFLVWVAYFFGRRYRHLWLPRLYPLAQAAALVLTLGATLPALVLNRRTVSSQWRLGLGWAVVLGALVYAFWLALRGEGSVAAAGSLQASKYLLPAGLGVIWIALLTRWRARRRAQLPAQWAAYLERRALFFLFCASGVWLMASLLHVYLNAGWSHPQLAPWVNNVYWLLALGIMVWGTVAQARKDWLLHQVYAWRQQTARALNVSALARQALRRFPGSWRRSVWRWVQAWAIYQQSRNHIEYLELNESWWAFDRRHYARSLLALLELPIYQQGQRQACIAWLSEALALPEPTALALLERIRNQTA